jgi:hypothetical protein
MDLTHRNDIGSIFGRAIRANMMYHYIPSWDIAKAVTDRAGKG